MERGHGRGSANYLYMLIVALYSSSLLLSTYLWRGAAAADDDQAGSSGAVQHQVGGTPGWSLPARSNVNYTSWASNQTFVVGDTLYFNYSSAYHDVRQVTAASYASCNASNPMAEWQDGETKIALNTSGTFYYICGVTGHCEQGQKVAVQVVTKHQVGGPPGWSLPSRSNVNYTVWASTQTFKLDDILYFNYSAVYHNVLQLATEAEYESCNVSKPVAQWDDGNTSLRLNETGTFYYACGFPTHCQQGQKVAILVEAASSGAAPGPAPGPAPATPSSSSSLSLTSTPCCSLRFFTLLLISVSFPFLKLFG